MVFTGQVRGGEKRKRGKKFVKNEKLKIKN